MQIVEGVYQISGIQYGTNSNTYLITADDQLILIDTGYSEYQYQVMEKSKKFWGLDHLPITHTFITHAHYDHSGNAYYYKKMGSKILIGKDDSKALEKGSEQTIDYLFGEKFVPCQVDRQLEDNDEIKIGNKIIRAIHMPGHTKGSMMFETMINDKRLLFMGDFLSIGPIGPENDFNVSLAWNGGPDYSLEDFRKSVDKSQKFSADILLPGHYFVWYGDCHRVFSKAYEKVLETHE